MESSIVKQMPQMLSHVLESCQWTKLADDGFLQLYSTNDTVIWLKHMKMKHLQNNHNKYMATDTMLGSIEVKWEAAHGLLIGTSRLTMDDLELS